MNRGPVASAALLAAVVALAGCAIRVPVNRAAAPPASPPSVVASLAVDAPVGRLVRDAPGNRTESAAAWAVLRRQLPRMLSSEYDYGQPEWPKGLPTTAKELVSLARPELVPVFTADPSRSATSVFAATRPRARDYVVVVNVRGKALGALDWRSPPPSGQVPGEDATWGSFYESFFLDFPGAEQLLRSHFASRDISVRYVDAGVGYFVVARSGAEEQAAFVPQQGDEWGVLGLRPDTLYAPSQVLDFLKRHPPGP
jgi:hypothetical protein